MRASRRSAVLLFLAMLATSTAGALSEDAYSTAVTIHDHRFEPAEIRVPAGKRIVLTVINTDPLSEEFDSPALKVEKVISGKSQGLVRFGPLAPGRYEFVGEYHEDTAKGQVVAQ